MYMGYIKCQYSCYGNILFNFVSVYSILISLFATKKINWLKMLFSLIFYYHMIVWQIKIKWKWQNISAVIPCKFSLKFDIIFFRMVSTKISRARWLTPQLIVHPQLNLKQTPILHFHNHIHISIVVYNYPDYLSVLHILLPPTCQIFDLLNYKL